MAYGLSPRAFIEDGPAARLLEVQAARTTARNWRVLNPDRRLAVVEMALQPANDCIDAFPFAL